MAGTTRQVTVERVVAAAPGAVYDLISDVTQMGRWSPENDSCRWLDQPGAVGSRFRGENRNGWRRWSTTCVVVIADPGRCFAFDVLFMRRWPAVRWTYEFEPDSAGSRVIETWTDRRPRWQTQLSTAITGVADRASHNRAGMEATLESLALATGTRR